MLKKKWTDAPFVLGPVIASRWVELFQMFNFPSRTHWLKTASHHFKVYLISVRRYSRLESDDGCENTLSGRSVLQVTGDLFVHQREFQGLVPRSFLGTWCPHFWQNLYNYRFHQLRESSTLPWAHRFSILLSTIRLIPYQLKKKTVND